MSIRPRRLRTNEKIRSLVKETRLHVDELVYPLFITHGKKIKKAIQPMPGQFQFSVDMLDDELKEISKLGIKSILLFGIPEHKDEIGSSSLKDDGIIQQAIRHIKSKFPELLIIADVCFCEYTDHGHCGKLNKTQDDVENDSSIELLAEQAVSYVKAGADIVAPSAMMDGMVAAIREGLDFAGFQNIPIMSYTVKYASALYGPFRIAAEGAPKFGNRASYQMDYANSNEAIREAQLDIEEGADFLMVKPAHTFLDVIYKIKNHFPEMPLAAYHPSGEFAMIKAAGEKGWIDETKVMLEVTTAIKRAGADLIITYFAKDLAKALKS